MSSHLSLDDIKARLRDGLERFVDDCADELWEAQNRIETLEAGSLVQPDPLIVDLAEFYEKEEAETRDTLGRIKKRHETRLLGDESSLIAHYEKNAEYYRVRAEALRRVLEAPSPLPRWRDISDEQKEGDTILVAVPGMKGPDDVMLIRWDCDPADENGQCWRRDDDERIDFEPTHFWPFTILALPAPPVKQAKP